LRDYAALDSVVRGEGELTRWSWCSRYAGNVDDPGLSFRAGRVIETPARPLIADLDSLPFPRVTRRRRLISASAIRLSSAAGAAIVIARFAASIRSTRPARASVSVFAACPIS
jgi:hypothetical protein